MSKVFECQCDSYEFLSGSEGFELLTYFPLTLSSAQQSSLHPHYIRSLWRSINVYNITTIFIAFHLQRKQTLDQQS